MASNHLPFRSNDGQQFCMSNVVPIKFEATRADTYQVVDQCSQFCCQPPPYATPFIMQASEHYLDLQLGLLHQGPWCNTTPQQAAPHEQQSGLWVQTQLPLYSAQESPYHVGQVLTSDACADQGKSLLKHHKLPFLCLHLCHKLCIVLART